MLVSESFIMLNEISRTNELILFQEHSSRHKNTRICQRNGRRNMKEYEQCSHQHTTHITVQLYSIIDALREGFFLGGGVKRLISNGPIGL